MGEYPSTTFLRFEEVNKKRKVMDRTTVDGITSGNRKEEIWIKKQIARVSPTKQTPHNSILLLSIVNCLVHLGGTTKQKSSTSLCVDLSSIGNNDRAEIQSLYCLYEEKKCLLFKSIIITHPSTNALNPFSRPP